MKLDRKFGVLSVALILVLAGCGKKPQPATPAPPPAEPSRQNGMSERAPERPASDDAAARRRATIEEMVFFDYDRYNIRSDAAETLSRKLPILREDAAIRLRIDGHADERGSIEYNLALGMRRAQAVKDYLAGFGLNASRFQAQSFGEERPLDPATTEAAYARNRRAEFYMTGGVSSR